MRSRARRTCVSSPMPRLRRALRRARAASTSDATSTTSSAADSSATGAAALCFLRLRSTGSRSRVTVPPAASIFSTADFENECAVTASFFVSSPSPRTLTSTDSFAISPAAFSASSVTSAPASKRSSRLADVHGLVVRPERADRHRVRGRVPAELSDPHVDRHLAAFEARRHLVRAGAGLLALDAAPGGPALAGAQAAADPLAGLARLRRLQVGEVQLVAHGLLGLDRHEMANLAQHALQLRRVLVLRAAADLARGRARASCRGGDRTDR